MPKQLVTMVSDVKKEVHSRKANHPVSRTTAAEAAATMAATLQLSFMSVVACMGLLYLKTAVSSWFPTMEDE